MWVAFKQGPVVTWSGGMAEENLGEQQVGCPVRATAAAGQRYAECAGGAQGCCLHLPIPQMHPFSVFRQDQQDRISPLMDKQWETCQALGGTP